MRSSSQVPKYGLGGDTLSGVASGVAAGSMFGPPGMVLGGLALGAAGFFGGKSAKEAEDQAKQDQLAQVQRQSSMQQKQADLQSMGPQHQYGDMMAAYGGEVGNPDTMIYKNKNKNKKGKLSFDSVEDAMSYYENISNSRIAIYDPIKKEVKSRGKNKAIKTIPSSDEAYKQFRDYQLNPMFDHTEPKEYAGGGATAPIMPGADAMYPVGTPAELEGGESGVTMQGDQFNVNGARHEDGGQMINVPGAPGLKDGARVYSDRFGPEGEKGPTYSDLNKKIAKGISKSEEALNDPNLTPIDRKTAELSVKQGKEKQDRLFKEQEGSPYKAKYSDNDTQTFDGGGMLADGMYGYLGGFGGAPAYGAMHGFADQFQPQQSGFRQLQNNPQTFDNPNLDQIVQGFNRGSVPSATPQQYTDNLNLDMSVYDTNINPMDDYKGRNNPLKSATDGPSFMDKIGSAAGIASLAPGLLNIGRGLLEKPEIDTPVQIDPAFMQAQQYDNSAELRANRRSSNIANRNIRNVATTKGQLLGGYAATSAGRGRADADSYARKGNMDAQYANQANQFNAQSMAQANQFNAQSTMASNRQNMANRAAKSNMFSKGLGQISGAVQNLEMGRNLGDMDSYKLRLLSKMFPEQNFNI